MYKKIFNSIFCFSILFMFSSLAFCAENVFYVSTSGSDSWSGKLDQSNKNKSDGPFATFSGAKQAVIKLIKSKGVPDGGIKIIISGGIYNIGETLKLTAEDSGSEKYPVKWVAKTGEKVRLIGGKVLDNFTPVKDESILKRLDSKSGKNVLQIDMNKAGITNLGSINPNSGPRMELFFKGKFMTIARYPNGNNWVTIADVPQIGEKLMNEGLDRDILRGAEIPRGRHYGRFTYDDPRPDRWQDMDNIWMHGFWVWDWADGYQKISKLDKEKKEIYPAEPYHSYGFTKGQRYYFLNILEELDSPGEWYADTKTGILYFWPPEDFKSGDVMVSTLETPMLSLQESSNISIEEIVFECSRTGAVTISGGENNRIAGCTFRNLGSEAVRIEGGTNNGILSSDIYDVAAGGISIRGGDRKTLTPGNNYAANNHIHHYCRILKTNRPAINISGVGNLMSHNYIHDSPHVGVFFGGNENVLEYNEIHDIALETGDVGAFYIGRDWTVRGNIVRYNYFHDLLGPGSGGVMGVYLDDAASGMTIFGNVFHKAGRAAFIGGGHNNIVENNIFVDCKPSVHVDARGLGWAKIYIAKDGSWRMYDKLAAVNYDKPPFSTKYPELAKILEQGDPAIPRGNKVLRNVSVGGNWINLDKNIEEGIVEIKDNLIDEDPHFVDSSKLNFQLKDDSPAYAKGFKKIPMEKIGLYTDEFRKSLPKKNQFEE